MNLRRWLHEHSLKLLAIRDTPEAIAGGVTIGVFFGFMPLFGMKTALALFFAWLTRRTISLRPLLPGRCMIFSFHSCRSSTDGNIRSGIISYRIRIIGPCACERFTGKDGRGITFGHFSPASASRCALEDSSARPHLFLSRFLLLVSIMARHSREKARSKEEIDKQLLAAQEQDPP